MSRIAIIGAGLSGRLLALNLLRFASSDAAVSVRMLDRGDERDMGPGLFLRGRLPAVERPGWTHGSLLGGSTALLDVEPGQGDFLPRRLYRDYILALVRKALQARAG